MHQDSLYRSLQASRDYYTRIFAPLSPTSEQRSAQRKELIDYFDRQIAEMEAHLQAIEQELGYKYSPPNRFSSRHFSYKDDDGDDSGDDSDDSAGDDDDSDSVNDSGSDTGGSNGGDHYNPDEARVPAGNPNGGQWTNGTNDEAAPDGGYATPGGVKYGDKVRDDMEERGWTSEQLDDAQQYGDRIDAINRTNGEPFTSATRYVSPDTGNSVVIDNATNEAIHTGGTGFRYGPGSGDVPGAIMQPSPNIRPIVGPEGYGNPIAVEGGEGMPIQGGGGISGFPNKPTQGEMEE